MGGYWVVFNVSEPHDYINVATPHLDATNELPSQVGANLLPDLILYVELIAILQQRKARQIFVQLQELTELIQDVGIR